MVSGGMSCVKYLLFAFNLVFVIFGILLLYAGFSTVAKIGNYERILEDAPNNAAIALIIVGFAIFILAFFGCCGAIKENSCMLTTFSSIILVILLIELIGAGLIFAFKSKLRATAEDGIKKVIETKYNATDPKLPVNVILDDIQTNLKCCGAINASDWKKNEFFGKNNSYPHSCCEKANEGIVDYCNEDQVYAKGCVDIMVNEIRGSFGFLGGIAIAVAVIQLLGVIFACSLSRSIKKEYEVV